MRCYSPPDKLLLIFHVLRIQGLFSKSLTPVYSCQDPPNPWHLCCHSSRQQTWTDPNPLSPPHQPGSPGRVALGMTHLWASASSIVLVTKWASIFLDELENDLSTEACSRPNLKGGARQNVIRDRKSFNFGALRKQESNFCSKVGQVFLAAFQLERQLLKEHCGLSWWYSGQESSCQCRERNRFDPCSGEIPHATEELKPMHQNYWACALPWSHKYWSLCSTREATAMRSPSMTTREQHPLTATRKKPACSNGRPTVAKNK